MSVRTESYGILDNLDAARLIDALQGSVESLQSQLGDYSPCRCGRELDCGPCGRAPGECDCSNIYDEEHEALLAELGDDPGTDDPLALTLMGYPSGIHCHDQDDRCLSGHCTGGDA